MDKRGVAHSTSSAYLKKFFSKTDHVSTILDNNSQLLRFTFSFENKGRLRLEVERNEVVDNGTTNEIPFEMLRGNVIGINYFWRVNFDYRIARNLQINLNYNGRKQGDGNIVHNMRSEARAYF